MPQIIAFVITLASEAMIITYLAKRQNLPLKWVLVTGFAANIVTHPIAWTFVRNMGLGDILLNVSLAEIGVFCVETLIYFVLLRLPLKTAMTWSSLANLGSFSLGIIYVVWGAIWQN